MKAGPEEPEIPIGEPAVFVAGDRASWVMTHYTQQGRRRNAGLPISDWADAFAVYAEALAIPILERCEVHCWPLIGHSTRDDNPMTFGSWVSDALIGMARAGVFGDAKLYAVRKVVVYAPRQVGMLGLRLRLYEGVRYGDV